jgi:hypothetical protein
LITDALTCRDQLRIKPVWRPMISVHYYEFAYCDPNQLRNNHPPVDAAFDPFERSVMPWRVDRRLSSLVSRPETACPAVKLG